MLRLVKHHGFGNDFLITFDAEGSDTELAKLAIALCDRRRGIGADGLLVGADAPGADAAMVLYNADGSRAEMSGNGIRCFAHAFAHRRGEDPPAHVTISTDAGMRPVELVATADPLTWLGTVDMGEVLDIAAPESWAALGTDPARPVAHLSVGNPHAVVVVEQVGTIDLEALGTKVPDVNLEIVEPGPGPHAITMRVHERGAGVTEACGTGACAAAVAAWRWGLAEPEDEKIVVQMDGGSASVGIVGDRGAGTPQVSLTGPTTYISAIEAPT